MANKKNLEDTAKVILEHMSGSLKEKALDITYMQAAVSIEKSALKVADSVSNITGDPADMVIVMKRAAQLILQDAIGMILALYKSGIPADEAREAIEMFMKDVQHSMVLKDWDDYEKFAARLIAARNEARKDGLRDDDMEIVPALYRDEMEKEYM